MVCCFIKATLVAFGSSSLFPFVHCADPPPSFTLLVVPVRNRDGILKCPPSPTRPTFTRPLGVLNPTPPIPPSPSPLFSPPSFLVLLFKIRVLAFHPPPVQYSNRVLGPRGVVRATIPLSSILLIPRQHGPYVAPTSFPTTSRPCDQTVPPLTKRLVPT